MPTSPSPWIAIGISALALFVAALALSVSILNYRRDRAALKVTSYYSEDPERFYASIRIKMVNAGRRPIILSTWVGAETKRGLLGRMSVVNRLGTYFEPIDALTLSEHQPHSFRLEVNDLCATLPDGEFIAFDDVWIVDTLGYRHKVKDIRKNITKLWKWQARPSPRC
jgi:hypothetical protein